MPITYIVLIIAAGLSGVRPSPGSRVFVIAASVVMVVIAAYLGAAVWFC